MIPINNTGEPTPLSLEKTCKLLQALLDLKADAQESDSSVPVIPTEVEQAIEDLLQAQNTFVTNIDKFLQKFKTYDHIGNFNVVKTMVETCPELLATTNNNDKGRLPIHYAVCSNIRQGQETFLPLFASVGMKYKIGGEEARGGLLIKNSNGNDVFNILARMEGTTGSFEALRNIQPEPLFFNEDVQRYSLVSCQLSLVRFDTASFERRMDVLKYLLDLNENCLFQKDSSNRIPLWHLCHQQTRGSDPKLLLKILEYLLKRSICIRPSCPTLGGLFYQSDEGFVINQLIDEFDMNDVWNSIETVLTSINSKNREQLPLILHRTIRCSPESVGEVLMRFPDSVNDRDKDNRLPIHVALDEGIGWGNPLVMMIQSNQHHLKHCDPVTKFPLLALAAREPSCDLRTIFYLIQKNPDCCVNRAIPMIESMSSESQPMKKRKLDDESSSRSMT